MIDLEAFKEATKRYHETHDICDMCMGVGCLPEHFGISNPDARPCSKCDGHGAIPKQMKLL